MRYRLIRFSSEGQLALDAYCEVPNEHGDNMIWAQTTGGTAILYDVLHKTCYDLNYPIHQKSSAGITWLQHEGDLHPYIQMLQLTGAL